MAKENHLMTPEELAQHNLVVKLREMTDKQLLDYIASQRSAVGMEPSGPSKAEIVKEFIELCATKGKGKRMGPATIAAMRAVAREAGMDIYGV